jgi:hypothetical protein
MRMVTKSDDRKVGCTTIKGYKVEKLNNEISIFALDKHDRPIRSQSISLPLDADYMAGIIASILCQFDNKLSIQAAILLALEFDDDKAKEITYA